MKKNFKSTKLILLFMFFVSLIVGIVILVIHFADPISTKVALLSATNENNSSSNESNNSSVDIWTIVAIIAAVVGILIVILVVIYIVKRLHKFRVMTGLEAKIPLSDLEFEITEESVKELELLENVE